MAGGYGREIGDTVAIHMNTLKLALKLHQRNAAARAVDAAVQNSAVPNAARLSAQTAFSV
jgi:hypothetical protein